MNAPSSYQNSGSKVTNIAIVTALHVVLGLALVNIKVLRGPIEETPPLTVTLDTPTVIIEPTVDHPTATESAPTIFVPPVAKKVFEVASAGNCAVPNYPANSARNGDTGTVGLALLIAPDGHVADSRVTSSSGFRELDRAAVAALSSCRFKPATTNGVPEAAWGKIAYVWTLE